MVMLQVQTPRDLMRKTCGGRKAVSRPLTPLQVSLQPLRKKSQEMPSELRMPLPTRPTSSEGWESLSEYLLSELPGCGYLDLLSGPLQELPDRWPGQV